MTDQRARDSLRELLSIMSDVHGNTAELGVWQGATTRVILEALPNVEHWGVDTFEGIPDRELHPDETHLLGQFADPQLDDLRELNRTEGRLHLVRGTFPDVELPEQRYIAAFYDADTGRGVHDFLDYFWPRVRVGGLLVFHDFAWRECPGVTRALRPFWDARMLFERPMITYMWKPEERCLPSIG